MNNSSVSLLAVALVTFLVTYPLLSPHFFPNLKMLTLITVFTPVISDVDFGKAFLAVMGLSAAFYALSFLFKSLGGKHSHFPLLRKNKSYPSEKEEISVLNSVVAQAMGAVPFAPRIGLDDQMWKSQHTKRGRMISYKDEIVTLGRELVPKIDNLQKPAAIVGLACRFPGGANSPSRFWELLCEGFDGICVVPSDHWDANFWLDPSTEKNMVGKHATNLGGYIQHPWNMFDSRFFGVSPREANRLDPQQRLLLELVEEVSEDAGLVLAGRNVAVFIGNSASDFAQLQFYDRHSVDTHTMTGNAQSIIANRLSFMYDLRGPSVAIDTACSSALVATHFGFSAMNNGESDMCIAGGVNILIKPEVTLAFSKLGVLSPQGRCKSFDASANGYVRSEGAGLILMRQCKEATNDHVYALVRGTGVNSDGHLAPGMTFPSKESQASLLTEVYKRADIDPSKVQFVEAHATGTAAGDPEECAAIGSIMSKRDKNHPLLLGSVKSNIGHLEPAAGIAGLIKTCLAMEHAQIPPSIHFTNPNPKIPFEKMNLKVVNRLTPWPRTDSVESMFAGVNSFGFGGTNSHVVLEKPWSSLPVLSTTEVAEDKQSPNVVLALSAKSEHALRFQVENMIRFLSETESDYRDVAFTTTARRQHFKHRLSVVGSSMEELSDSLLAWLSGTYGANVHQGTYDGVDQSGVGFVFAGQGCEWMRMGLGLIESEPVFRDTFSKISDIFQRLSGFSLLDILAKPEQTSQIHETRFAQPTIFAVEVALVELIKSWGILPKVVVGHSIGEIAAAFTAGYLTLEDAVLVNYHMSRLEHRTTGSMLACQLSENEASTLLTEYTDVTVSAVNSPTMVTLSGPTASIDRMTGILKNKEVFCKRLPISGGFHGPLMDVIHDEFVNSLTNLKHQNPSIRMISTSQNESDMLINAAEYWWKNVRQPVQFCSAIESLVNERCDMIIEISPNPVMFSNILEITNSVPISRTLACKQEKEHKSLSLFLSQVYTSGVTVAWDAVWKHCDVKPVVGLPLYPWQRQSYWNEPADVQENRRGGARPHPFLRRRLKVGNPIWEAEVTTAHFPWIAHHCIQGNIVVPGVTYLECFAGAGAQVFADQPVVVRDVKFSKAFYMNPGEVHLVQVQMMQSDENPDVYNAQIISKIEPDGAWKTHASGIIENDGVNNFDWQTGGIPVEQLMLSCSEQLNVKDFYGELFTDGLELNEAFQRIQKLWIDPDKTLAIGLVKPWAQSTQDDLVSFQHFHPTCLDSILQTGLSLRTHFGAFFPTKVKRMRITGKFSGQGHIWSVCRAKATEKTTEVLTTILNERGQILGEIFGIEITFLTDNQADGEECYEYEWEMMDHPRLFMKDPSPIPKVSHLQTICRKHALEVVGPQYRAETEVYGVLEPALNELTIKYAVNALESVGCSLPIPSNVSIDTIADQCSIVPNHHQLFARLVHLVNENTAVNETPLGELEISLMKKHQASRPSIQLTARCGNQLSGILTGQINPLDLLFSDDTAEAFYRDDAICSINSAIASHMIDTFSKSWPAGRPLRVLEIGAGTGGTTVHILPRLPRAETEYVFSDIGRSFLKTAKEKFKEYPFIRYQPLDIEKNPANQLGDGIEPHSFDLIVAAYVIHATTDLKESLSNILYLLRPGGRLILLEMTRQAYWYDIVWGTTPGWWRFKDTDLRPEHPLINATQWDSTLREVGFDEIGYIQDSCEIEGQAAVFIAQAPHSITVSLPDVPSSSSKHYLLLKTEGNTVSEMVQQKLIECGHTVDTLSRSEVSTLETMKAYLTNTKDTRADAIIDCWPLDIPELDENTTAEDLAAINRDCGIHSEYDIIRALSDLSVEISPSLTPKVFIVTMGAFVVDNAVESTVNPAQRALWGFARVAFGEHPEYAITCVDLPTNPCTADADSLVETIVKEEEDRNEEIGIRAGRIYAHKLKRRDGLQSVSPSLCPVQTKSIRSAVQAHCSGNSTISLTESSLLANRAKLQSDMVAVRVKASGVAFRDVMLFNGMLPEGAKRNSFFGDSLGMEFSGIVEQIGADVTSVNVGDEVMGLARSCISTHVIAPSMFVFKKPECISHTEAAGMSMQAVTALFGLRECGRLSEGDSVLIHAAAGGVGMIAIQLAKLMGAVVYATAGAEFKHELLHLLGVDHVFDSRSVSFAKDIMDATSGRGVDVVLNSLSGALLQAGLSCLAVDGRFVEIGKADIYGNSQLDMGLFSSSISYNAVAIDRLMLDKPHTVSKVLADVVSFLHDGSIQSIPTRVFPFTETKAALKYLTQAKHVGKVIVAPSEGSVVALPKYNVKNDTPVRDNCTYMITGGTKGFGLAIAQWLVSRGAKFLMLVSRSEPNSEDLKTINEMRAIGTTIALRKTDIRMEEDVAETLGVLRSTMPPLGGVVHSAMVLSDGLISSLNHDDYDLVLDPKATGAWLMHKHTINDSLDFFVLMSSMNASLGTPAQSNYAAANMFLDGLAVYRRSLGLAGTSINWGVLGETGFVHRTGQVSTILKSYGFDAFTPRWATLMLEKILMANMTNIGAFRLNVVQFFKALPQLSRGLKFSHLLSENESVSQSTGPSSPESLSAMVESLIQLPQKEAEARLEVIVIKAAASGLGISPEDIKSDDVLDSLGWDSMIAAEMKGSIDRILGLDTPVVEFIRTPRPCTIAQRLLVRVKEKYGTSEKPQKEAQPAQEVVTVKQEVQVEQKRTAYVFTGQGSAKPGMGMDLYENSTDARKLWDDVDDHFQQKFGISIIKIVKENPKEMKISFEGEKGEKWRSNLMGLHYEEGSKEISVFSTITSTSTSYTFSSPNGLLFATHFTQPIVTAYEVAAFRHLRSCGVIDSEAYFSGHSLGEYCALVACADISTVTEMTELTFLRGLIMQNAVERDENGASPYAMMAVSPRRVGPTFTITKLEAIVTLIRKNMDILIEVVNYNVLNDQYVLAGHKQALWVLGNVLQSIKENAEVKVVVEIAKIVTECPNDPVLERVGAATPISGIDVPFHSSLLLHLVPGFRSFLQKRLLGNLDLSVLENKWIPSINGKVFTITKQYAQDLFELTKSPILATLVASWQDYDRNHVAELLLQELLAYQFASAVKWIDVQTTLIDTIKIERVIEIGPAAVLSRMMSRTSQSRKAVIEVLSYATDIALLLALR